ncbi:MULTISPECIES: hypothetical protein [unclassified Streptomyces]|uniref:hypothetical protein n=1 Tax=unclassified Streptomyces TaxID=2593676 RepID=UPI001F03302B|nr:MULTISPECIES: hypothetical protein [unclassified Streptomyces]MCH0566448.1 hypothetical protein [Streptomyces sp. MUM 2J]MCH0566453.1 hypothetical protein [Streptomyces sp. MUM 2J]MCH0566459.1 hypothetical protein [Streptomyces sp. MUM 2J]MCH0571842.1 hypothetical protein [Streptomyces sp. MUM 136J]MCH0571877.1 hypothetical protein [Streptomyces sp. MUM 136J]
MLENMIDVQARDLGELHEEHEGMFKSAQLPVAATPAGAVVLVTVAVVCGVAYAAAEG